MRGAGLLGGGDGAFHIAGAEIGDAPQQWIGHRGTWRRCRRGDLMGYLRTRDLDRAHENRPRRGVIHAQRVRSSESRLKEERNALVGAGCRQ
jgi:hypothetical protein